MNPMRMGEGKKKPTLCSRRLSNVNGYCLLVIVFVAIAEMQLRYEPNIPPHAYGEGTREGQPCCDSERGSYKMR